MNELYDCKPIFMKEKVPYLREERKGHWTIAAEMVGETVLNFTAKQVLDLCDGSQAIGSIIEKMRKEYPDVDAKTIGIDVVNILSLFSRLMLVGWASADPFVSRYREPIDDAVSVEVAQSDDIRTLIEFMKNCDCFSGNKVLSDGQVIYMAPSRNASDYNELQLRRRLFTYAEDFFLLKQHDTVKGILSFNLNTWHSSALSIARVGIFSCPASYLAKLMFYGVTKLPFVSSTDVLKLQFDFNPGDEAGSRIGELLKHQSWNVESVLENEYTYGSIIHRIEFLYNKEDFAETRSRRKMLTSQLSLAK